jgi:hypothetical protein
MSDFVLLLLMMRALWDRLMSYRYLESNAITTIAAGVFTDLTITLNLFGISLSPLAE